MKLTIQHQKKSRICGFVFLMLASTPMHADDIKIVIVESPTAEEINQAQEFYSSVGYTTKIIPNDKVILAFHKHSVVGVVRLCCEENCYILRGMQIDPNYQRQKIGTHLIYVLNKYIGSQTCWCIPHSWLESFYNQIGFEKIDESKAPLFLRHRINQMRAEHPQLIIMVKNLEQYENKN